MEGGVMKRGGSERGVVEEEREGRGGGEAGFTG